MTNAGIAAHPIGVQLAPQAPAPAAATVVLAVIAIAVSVVSATIAIVSAYLTLLQRGKLRMTRPTLVAFVGSEGPKVVIRATLFSTARSGNMIESMFVRVSREQSVQTLNIWGFGENGQEFGGGLFVGREGKAHFHHFLPPRDGTQFQFLPGNLKLEVFAKTVNAANDTCVFEQTLQLTQAQADDANHPNGSTMFNWGPETSSYHAHSGRRGLELPESGTTSVPGPEQLTVELLPSDGAGLLFERDGSAKLHYKIRIKNCGTFPITPLEMRLNFKAWGDGGFNHEKRDILVHAEYHELVPGAEQRPIEYPIVIETPSSKPPPAIRLSIAGHVMTGSPMWSGTKKADVNWFAWAAVIDNRLGPAQLIQR